VCIRAGVKGIIFAGGRNIVARMTDGSVVRVRLEGEEFVAPERMAVPAFLELEEVDEGTTTYGRMSDGSYVTFNLDHFGRWEEDVPLVLYCLMGKAGWVGTWNDGFGVDLRSGAWTNLVEFAPGHRLAVDQVRWIRTDPRPGKYVTFGMQGPACRSYDYRERTSTSASSNVVRTIGAQPKAATGLRATAASAYRWVGRQVRPARAGHAAPARPQILGRLLDMQPTRELAWSLYSMTRLLAAEVQDPSAWRSPEQKIGVQEMLASARKALDTLRETLMKDPDALSVLPSHAPDNARRAAVAQMAVKASEELDRIAERMEEKDRAPFYGP
jgi:hypothetical protein